MNILLWLTRPPRPNCCAESSHIVGDPSVATTELPNVAGFDLVCGADSVSLPSADACAVDVGTIDGRGPESSNS